MSLDTGEPPDDLKLSLVIRDLHLYGTLEGLPEGECGETYLGTVEIFGMPFSVTAVRVVDTSLGQVAACDPCDVLDDLSMIDPGPWVTVAIPGLPGEYVLWITPHYREG